MEDLAFGTSNSKFGILVNEALSSFFKCIDRLIVPPVGVVPILIVVTTGGIESYIALVNQNHWGREGTKHTMGKLVAANGTERAIS
jgi:hypothetical protein